MATNNVSICRVCLSQEHGLKTMTDHPFVNFSQFFTLLTSVLIDYQNEITNLICERCMNRVIDAYELRKLALSSDLYLRLKGLQPKQSDPVVTDIEEKNNDGSKENAESKKKFGCPICCKKFSYQSEMLRHKSTHTPGYRCSTCDKTFGFKSSLLRHEKVHYRSGKAVCEICSSQFRDRDLLQRHKQYAHSVKNLKCSQCDARFSTGSALRTHERTHTHARLACRHQHCDKSFRLPHQRKRHEAMHSGRKSFFCDVCRKGFIQSHHLASHMAALHRPDSRLVCLVADCYKTFPNKYSLKRHEELHEKESVRCQKCDKMFSSSINLRRHHLRCSQPGEQQPGAQEKSLCSFCQKRFNFKYLKKHMSRCRAKVLRTKSTPNTIKLNPKTPINNFNFDDVEINKVSAKNFNAIDPTKEIMKSEQIVEDVADMMEDQLASKVNACSVSTPSIEDVGSLCGGCSGEVKPPDVDSADCKALLGKCIVSSEECICARVSRKEDPLPEYLTTPLLVALQQQGYDPT